MNKFIALAFVSAVAISAFAAPAKPQTEIDCAVMKGHKVNIKDATAKHMYADYKGNRYFFCCGGCPTEFKANPAKFAKAPHIATPKAK